MLEVANQFSVCRKTITDLWNIAKKQIESGEALNVNSKIKGKKCRQRNVFDAEKFKSIPLSERTTQHSTAEALGVSQSAIARWIADKTIESHTNAIKPQLNEKNKLDRLLFSLAQLHYDEVCKKVKFNDQSNVIHMDEKWFYLTKPSRRFYLAKGEKRPYRSIQSKKFIGKVMFMCAVARPKYGPNGEVLFDGKIGIWPFIVEVPAKRNSRNRVAGTMETKCIESVNKQVIKDMIIRIVVPAIKAKWPENESKHIIIQQDNARPHIKNSDPDFTAAANQDGWNIELSCQPPNSPDLNVLDLGFFRAIQSLQQRTNCYKLDKLVIEVNKAFANLEVIKLKYVFITLQACMLEVMKRKGAYMNNVGDSSTITPLVDAVNAHVNAFVVAVINDMNEPVGSITEPIGCSNEPTGASVIDLTEQQMQ
ncbi:uncharacterized protein LOC141655747 [Silene latifolia]|uniref:uncharacterized protein LOC141655747 n=1 Tax=Silene latifolia TaxID=37657 RepID=UPI003D77E88C